MNTKQIHNIDNLAHYTITHEEKLFKVASGNQCGFTGTLEYAIWYAIEWLREEKFQLLNESDLMILKKMGLKREQTVEGLKDSLCGSKINKRYYAQLFNEILSNEQTTSLNEYNYFLYSEILFVLNNQVNMD